ncbi:hypothetical protein M9458_021331, partial [Cirrhinus mrigala]
SLSPCNASNECISHQLGSNHDGCHLTWHINCLEMLAVLGKHFLPDLRHCHVLLRTNNTVEIYYINHQGVLCSRPLYKLAPQILVWSQDKLLLLRAVNVPGHLSMGADILSRPGEWMLYPESGVHRIPRRPVCQPCRTFCPEMSSCYTRSQSLVRLVMDQEVTTLLRKESIEMVPPHVRESGFYSRHFIVPKKDGGSGGPLCDLGDIAISPLVLSDSFSSPGVHGGHSTDVAKASSVRLSPDCSVPGSFGESVLGRGPSSLSSPILAGPRMVLGPDFPSRRLSMGDSYQEGSFLSGGGQHPPPSPGVVEVVCVAPEGAHLIASGLSTEVVETILQSRAPSTRKLYSLKWRLFTSWCGHRQQDPVNCPVSTVLEILHYRFSAGLAHFILKVYVAAISGYHAPLGGSSVGRNPLVTGALRLRPLA